MPPKVSVYCSSPLATALDFRRTLQKSLFDARQERMLWQERIREIVQHVKKNKEEIEELQAQILQRFDNYEPSPAFFAARARYKKEKAKKIDESKAQSVGKRKKPDDTNYAPSRHFLRIEQREESALEDVRIRAAQLRRRVRQLESEHGVEESSGSDGSHEERGLQFVVTKQGLVRRRRIGTESASVHESIVSGFGPSTDVNRALAYFVHPNEDSDSDNDPLVPPCPLALLNTEQNPLIQPSPPLPTSHCPSGDSEDQNILAEDPPGWGGLSDWDEEELSPHSIQLVITKDSRVVKRELKKVSAHVAQQVKDVFRPLACWIRHAATPCPHCPQSETKNLTLSKV